MRKSIYIFTVAFFLRLLFENPAFFLNSVPEKITLFFGGAFICFGMLSFLFKSAKIAPAPIHLYILFIVASSFSSINSNDPLVFLLFWIKISSLYFMFIFGYNTVLGKKDLTVFFDLLIFSSYFFILVGLYQYYFGKAKYSINYWGNEIYSVFSTFSHPNQFAFYLAIILFVIICQLAFKKVSIRYLASFLVTYYTLLLTSSRSVLLVFTVSAFLFAMSFKKVRKWIPLFIFMFLVFAAPMIIGYSQAILSPHKGQINSVDFRMIINRALLFEAFPEHPFLGFGLGSSENIVDQFTDFGIIAPHNDYLKILIGAGLVGFIPFILFASYPFRKLLHKRNLILSVEYKLILTITLFFVTVLVSTNQIGNLSTSGFAFLILGSLYKFYDINTASNVAK